MAGAPVRKQTMTTDYYLTEAEIKNIRQGHYDDVLELCYDLDAWEQALIHAQHERTAKLKDVEIARANVLMEQGSIRIEELRRERDAQEAKYASLVAFVERFSKHSNCYCGDCDEARKLLVALGEGS